MCFCLLQLAVESCDFSQADIIFFNIAMYKLSKFTQNEDFFHPGPFRVKTVFIL